MHLFNRLIDILLDIYFSTSLLSLPSLCVDKRTDNWLLVYSPVPLSCIFISYLIIIWAGPKLMAKRQPVNLKPVLIVYNLAMVCLSAYMFYEVFLSARTTFLPKTPKL